MSTLLVAGGRSPIAARSTSRHSAAAPTTGLRRRTTQSGRRRRRRRRARSWRRVAAQPARNGSADAQRVRARPAGSSSPSAPAAPVIRSGETNRGAAATAAAPARPPPPRRSGAAPARRTAPGAAPRPGSSGWKRHERRGERDGLVVVRHGLAGALAQGASSSCSRAASAHSSSCRDASTCEPRHQQAPAAGQPPPGSTSSARRRRAHIPNIPRSSAAPGRRVGRVRRRIVRAGVDVHAMRLSSGVLPTSPRPRTRPGRSSTIWKSTLSPGETSTGRQIGFARGVPNGGRKVAKEVVAERLANMISRQRSPTASTRRRGVL